MSDTSSGFMRKRFMVRGNLHGSGFSAAIFRLVRSLNLRGWMRPFSKGYEIQVEGDEGTLRGFESQLLSRFQLHYSPFSVNACLLDTKGDASFRLLDPEEDQPSGRWMRPDTCPCPDCVGEMLNPHNRRFFYPFTFCADCGPRYTIAHKGLLRREDTLLGKYALCEQCQAEIGNSRDRRFLHTFNTCPICGPGVELWDHRGAPHTRQREALIQAASVLDQGRVLAVKETTGFSLIALATANEPIRRMRSMLEKPLQPIPLMIGSPDAADAFALMSAEEREWLLSPMAPSVRVKRRESSMSLSDLMAPHGNQLDVCLPGSGIFHLLVNLLNLPLAVISDTGHRLPYACNEAEALQEFHGLVDYMLISDLPLLRSIPKTLLQRIGQEKQVLKHGVGIVPLEIQIPVKSDQVLALGGKNTTSLGLKTEDRCFLLSPLGALKDGASLDFFFDGVQDAKRSFDFKPDSLEADVDPHGLTTQYALSTGMEVQQIDHDLAHIMSTLSGPSETDGILGICFDEGIGKDKKGVMGGGELLWLNGTAWQRVAGFGSFWLPGGDHALDDNRACLFGMLHEAFGKEMWEMLPLRLRAQLNLPEVERWNNVFDLKLQCRKTRSVTQWWLGLAALLTDSNRNRYQGDTFSALEAITDRELEPARSVKPYSHPMSRVEGGDVHLVLDWIPMIREIIADLQQGRRSEYILRRVYETFSKWVLGIAAAVHPTCIVLSGSAFENRTWTEQFLETLRQHGFKTLVPNRIPFNDSGLAVGQLFAASRGMDSQSSEIPDICKAIFKLSHSVKHSKTIKGSDPES